MKIEDIKKVFRGIRSTKKEIELRLRFLDDVKRMDLDTAGIEASVLSQVDALRERVTLADRMLASLEPEERTVLTARYYVGIRWEYIEAHTLYSVSQSQRIHDRAMKKLTAFFEPEADTRPAPIRAGRPAHLQSQ